jgi:hypothetical protein
MSSIARLSLNITNFFSFTIEGPNSMTEKLMLYKDLVQFQQQRFDLSLMINRLVLWT